MKGIQIRVALFAVAMAAVLWGYQVLLLHHGPMMFTDPMEDLSYGWYVPLMSLYVVWRERAKIRASLGAPSAWGALLAVPFFFAGFLGVRGTQVRLEIVGFVGLLITLTWAFWGRRTMQRILFPALFLLFCIPLHTYLDIVTIHLRVLAVSSAYGILKGIGVDIIREGTMLMSPTGAFGIDVADPCSGMRSLFAMMAVAMGYAYFTQPNWLRRVLLFACSIPIVVFGNIVRIFTIVLTAATCSADFATGFYHDYSGYVVFLVSIALMVGTGELITHACARSRGTPPSAPADSEKSDTPTCQCSRTKAAVLPAALTVALLAAMVIQGHTVEPVLCEAPDVKLGEIPGYSAQPYDPSEAELERLPKDTRFDKCHYTAGDGSWYQVSVVIGGRSKSSIHRPELCLPSQGNQMLDPHTITVGARDWHRVNLAHQQKPTIGFSYTFFNQAGYATSSHMRRIFQDVWDRSMLGRIDRWVMVTVASSTPDDAKLSQFLSKLEESLK